MSTPLYTFNEFFVKLSARNNTNMPTEKNHKIIRVSVSEAARLLGIDSHTIRRAIKTEEVTYAVVQGRYKINFESLVKWSQQKIRIKNKMNKDGIGQYVAKWKIKNKLYSPNPGSMDHGTLITKKKRPSGRFFSKFKVPIFPLFSISVDK